MAPSTSTWPAGKSTRGLIEELLDEQQLLTPVADFARKHERGEVDGAAGPYRDLLPVTPLMRGEQYAFEVDLDKCSGCKACVTACHSLNGLDDNETWRDVGLLVSPPSKPWVPAPAIQQTVTTACHHCVDPACLNGCPVLAYEKDPLTGIVRHLDDQCIGCQYCVLKCPYDVPKYNARLGIVRKCDLCANRLAVGEAPACVQACPNEAIRITNVSKAEVSIAFRQRSAQFLPGAPAGEYTLPTTRYVSSYDADRRVREFGEHAERPVRTPKLVAADGMALRPQPAHWPLVLMLVLSQASVGVALAALFAAAAAPLLVLALVLGAASVGAGILHLGRPLGAWRCFLGLRRSWLSREILVFGLFVPWLATAVLAPSFAPTLIVSNIRAVALGAALIGLAGVFCSVMIYHDTQRTLWHARRSAGLFFGSVALFAGAAAFAMNGFGGMPMLLLAIGTVAKLALEVSVLRHVVDREVTPLKKTALLVTGLFQHFAFARVVCALLGGIGLPLLLHTGAFGSLGPAVAWLAFALLFAGELLERLLFFRTVDAPKMPGGFAA